MRTFAVVLMALALAPWGALAGGPPQGPMPAADAGHDIAVQGGKWVLVPRTEANPAAPPQVDSDELDAARRTCLAYMGLHGAWRRDAPAACASVEAKWEARRAGQVQGGRALAPEQRAKDEALVNDADRRF
jgi:hypothetical protein